MGKIYFKLLLVLVVMIAMNSGCQSPSSWEYNNYNSTKAENTTKPITIRFAHQIYPSNSRIAKVNQAIDEFAKENKDKFNLIQEISISDDIKQKIQTDIAENNLPDVFWYFGTPSEATNIVQSGLVIRASEFLAVSKNTKKEDFYDWAWEDSKINGDNWSIPTEGWTGAWLANRKLFEKYGLAYPKKMEDLISLAKVFNQHNIYTLAMGSKGGNPMHWFVDMIYVQYPGAIDNLNQLGTTWKYDRDNLKRALDLIIKMRDNGVFPRDTVTNGDWLPQFSLYNNSQAALLPAFTWVLSNLNPEIEAASDIIEIPSVEGGVLDTSQYSLRGSSPGLYINKKSFYDPAKQSAIIALIDFLCGKKMAELKAYYKCEIPVRVDVQLDPNSVPIQIYNTFVERDKNRKTFPIHMLKVPERNSWANYENNLDELMAGNMNTDQFLNKTQAYMNMYKEMYNN
jgi:raffinose/stachyose/melibiose transport system substrate-binding protein